MNIAQILSELLIACQGVRALLQSVAATLVHVAQENVPFHISTQVDIIEAQTSDSTFGLAAIQAELATFQATTATDFTAVLTAIAGIETHLTSGVTVDAFTGSAPANIADAVWDAVDTLNVIQRGDELAQAYNYAQHKSAIDETVLTVQAPWPWMVGGTWGSSGLGNPNPATIVPVDVSTIIAGDLTSYDWIFRVYDSDLSGFLGDDGMYTVTDLTESAFNWVAYIPQDQWLELKAALGLGTASIAAPIWPGLAGVTLGTPVAISLTFTVDGPLDGVLVALTAVPTLKGHYVYDDIDQSLKIGALTFVSDNGDAEYVQALGFTNEVYVPKNMAHADSCKVRTVSGVTGTVTPFTIP